jgi:predicted Holliday junction resolvase-like endonuclease
MKIYLILGALILVLFFILFLLAKKINKQNKEIKDLEHDLQVEIEIAKQKDKIHTGNDDIDFDNSIELLQKYSDSRNN